MKTTQTYIFSFFYVGTLNNSKVANQCITSGNITQKLCCLLFDYQ